MSECLKKYNVIYADPAWQYGDNTGRGFKHGAKDKYSIMSLKDICDMPINDITQDNSLLFIWATVPLLPEALIVIEAWGFKYKTMITWDKTGILGMGWWLRGNTEHLIVAIKGDVKPFKYQGKNILSTKVGKHSEKPPLFRNLVSQLSEMSMGKNINKLELFARSDEGMFPNHKFQDGWDVWGNEVENSIELKN